MVAFARLRECGPWVLLGFQDPWASDFRVGIASGSLSCVELLTSWSSGEANVCSSITCNNV